METRRLGDSDMDLSVLGFGSWAAGGGGWEFAWGPQDDAASIAAIRRALELGINWIDTAAVYGLGHSEEVVARAVEGASPRPYVFTKGSMPWDAQGRIGRSLRGRLDPPRVRGEPAPAAHRARSTCTRSTGRCGTRRRWTRAGRRSPR